MLKDLNNLMLVCHICHQEIDMVPKKAFKKRKKVSKKHGHVTQPEECWSSEPDAVSSNLTVPDFLFP